MSTRFFFLLMLFGLLVIPLPAEVAAFEDHIDWINRPSKKTKINDFRGEPAFADEHTDGTRKSESEYQCTEFVQRVAAKLTRYPITGMRTNYGSDNPPQLFYKDKRTKEPYIPKLITEASKVKAGSLIWFKDGHVAILKSNLAKDPEYKRNKEGKNVPEFYFGEIVEQNWANQWMVARSRKLHFKKEDNSYWRIYENGKPLQSYGKVRFFHIEPFNEFPHPPVSAALATALVIDRSGSMRGEKLEKALQAAKAYVTTMTSDDQASLSVFSDRANTELTMANRDQIIGSNLDSALSSVSAHSATNIGAGLEQGFSQLENASADPDSKVALLMSDGKNNRGSWRSVAEKFKTKHWPVYTVGFGKDADEAALTEIAKITGGTYWPAETQNVANVYQVISAHAKRKCILLSVNEPLAPNGELAYQIPVSQGAEHLNVFTNWQGSRLETCLVLPNGQTLTGKQLRRNGGRFVEGQVFQMLEVNNPQPGEWGLEVSWAEPPPVPEQVNIAVSEKTDVFANMLGFRAEYALGEQVIINVQAAELIGTWNKVPLKNVSVNVRIRKPGPEMIRMVQAQSQNWTMYKDVMLDATRNVKLFDDGAHNDYNAGDSIWGNTFTETDKNGAYMVTTTITGEKQNGQRIERILQGSFQVGPILQNAVTTSQTLQYIDRAQSYIDSNTPYKEETFSRPVETIERLQGDPLDSINRLLKGTK